LLGLINGVVLHDSKLPAAITTTKVFYSQVSWGRLEMKPHELKNRYKIRVKKKEKIKGDKKLNKKGEKTIKH
jgi:hypothetical protein